MNHFSNKKRLYAFTEKLAELTDSGIPLHKSFEIIAKNCRNDRKIKSASEFLNKRLLEGTKFSVALKMMTCMTVPDWYAAYIMVAEECGCIRPILLYLKKLLENQNSDSEKFFDALIYPCLVCLLTALAGFFSVFYFLPSLAMLFSENVEQIQAQAARTMVLADIFLFAAFSCIALFMKKLCMPSSCLGVLRAMAFLTENSVPTLSAVSCAFAFVGRKKTLALALLSIRKNLLEGIKLSECFGAAFLKAGFKTEGVILAENLAIDQESGRANGFEKTAAFLARRNERRAKLFFSLLQPTLLFIASVYITLILNTAFMPYLTNFGGLL